MKAKRFAALTLALALTLTACGGNGETGEDPETKSGEITDFVDWELSNAEMETFLIQYSEARVDLQVLVNCVSPLLEVDNHGKLHGALADTWGTDDNGLTWTFHLKEGVHWVNQAGEEQAECVAQDFLTSMEWILNYHKNAAKNTSMLTALIDGAQEYYDYTKDLPEEEAKALKATDETFLSTVGIEAPDDYTVVYHCDGPCPYFETVTCAACLFPLSQALVDTLGVDGTFSQTPETMWYNGPYRITEFVQNNSKILERNASYWDQDCKLFNSVHVQMVQDGNMDDQLFMNGEVDRCDLSEANLRLIYDDENNEFHDDLVPKRAPAQNRCIQFNYNKNLEDGTPDVNWNTAIANEAFRLSLYYGMELTSYWSRSDFIDPSSNESLCFTTHNVGTFSDGTDYADRVIELLGLTGGGRYDADKAASYKAQAMSELEGKVTFPVEIDYYVPSSNQDEIDRGIVLKGIIEEGLGTDYVTVNIETYVSNNRQEVLHPHLHSFSIAGWTADYGDPENFITNFMYGTDAAYFANTITMANEATDPEIVGIFKEYTALCEKANAIVDDMDARYEAQAQAEAYLISHAVIIPLYTTKQWSLTKVDAFSQPFAGYSALPYMYKNFETQTEPVTAEQYAQSQTDYNAGTK